MDTDDLGDETYNAIIVEAERFNHVLTLHFGLICGQCENEAEFIKEAKSLIREFEQYNEAEIEDVFFGEPPPKNELHKAVVRILGNVASLENSGAMKSRENNRNEL